MSMKDILEKENLPKPPQVGKIVEGKLINKARAAVFLDLGPLGTGIIYGREFLQARNDLRRYKIGDTIFSKVVETVNEDGYVELSLSQASSEMTWGKLKAAREKDEPLEVKITGANKGGLLSEIFGVPAFLPVSQLSPDHYPRVEKGDSAKILLELQKFVGQTLNVKIFDIDPREGKLIISEKAKENEKMKKVLDSFKVGDVVEGEITGVTDFGVFMKFLSPGAEDNVELEGLIHISELDWQLIEDPADIVKVGEKVQAKIIEIRDGKISLSLKALKIDPWSDIEEQFKKGDVVSAKVTKINPFGAFVQLTPKIQGLCHISEFGTKQNMESSLEIGKTYQFQILSIEPKEHRMSLKLADKA